MEKQLGNMSVLELEAELQRLQIRYHEFIHGNDTHKLASLTGKIQNIKKEFEERRDSHFKHNDND